MKRLWVILGALAMVCALNVTEAGAVKLQKKDLGWYDQTATDMSLRVKTKTAITNSGTGVDTTTSFSLLDCALPFSKLDAANADSAQMAKVVFITDSTVAVTNDLTKPVFAVDVSEDGVNWQTVMVSDVTIASGAKMWGVPIWASTGEGQGSLTVINNPYFARQIRVRVTAATGNQYAVRPQLWYWTE